MLLADLEAEAEAGGLEAVVLGSVLKGWNNKGWILEGREVRVSRKVCGDYCRRRGFHAPELVRPPLQTNHVSVTNQPPPFSFKASIFSEWDFHHQEGEGGGENHDKVPFILTPFSYAQHAPAIVNQTQPRTLLYPPKEPDKLFLNFFASLGEGIFSHFV